MWFRDMGCYNVHPGYLPGYRRRCLRFGAEAATVESSCVIAHEACTDPAPAAVARSASLATRADVGFFPTAYAVG
jgi:hypothetical protein